MLLRLLIATAVFASAADLAVYPSGVVWPANQLRVYVVFPEAQARGRVLEKIHLLREDGSEVKSAFLDLELWDPEQRRLTLLFDPGRVKQGVDSAGPVLDEGRSYALVIDQHRHGFRVGPRAAEGIQVSRWKLDLPSGPRQPFTLRFDRPLDWGLLQHTFEIVSPAGEVLDGTEEIRDEERSWTFRPVNSWKAGRYRIRIHPALEDGAGNRLGRAFDVDVRSPKPSSETPALLEFDLPDFARSER